MVYTIIESFTPSDGERWTNYCAWRGINFERFDSIDGILRPSLCSKPSDEDWPHILKEDFMLHYFIDLEYAQKKKTKIGYGDLVGVKFDQHDESTIGFLGYDLIDSSSNISLLTNWGDDVEIINQAISSAGLVRNWAVIEGIQKELFKSHGDDAHVDGCTIVSLYKPKDSPLRV